MIKTLLILSLVICGSSAFAAKKSCGKVTKLKGKAFYVSDRSQNEIPIEKRQKVCVGDTVRTEKKSKVTIRFRKKNRISLSPNTVLKISEFEYKKSTKKALINLVHGKLRSAVKSDFSGKDNYFRVKTPSVVAGVRGTEFLVSYNESEKKSEVVTFDGSVNAFPVDQNGGIGSPVEVKPGFGLTVDKDRIMSVPKQVPQKRLNRLKNQTSTSTPKKKDAPKNSNLRKKFESQQVIKKAPPQTKKAADQKSRTDAPPKPGDGAPRPPADGPPPKPPADGIQPPPPGPPPPGS